MSERMKMTNAWSLESKNEYAGKIVELLGGREKFSALKTKMEEMQKLVEK